MCPAQRNPSASHPAGSAVPSRPAVRRPTRPARGVSLLWVRQVRILEIKRKENRESIGSNAMDMMDFWFELAE